MTFRARSFTMLVAVLAAAAGSASANGPAELPPDGYDAPQYVDSAGCVFVRAELDGTVNWIPRLTSEREPVCGMQPSLSVVVPEAVAAAQPEPEQTAAVEPPATPKPARKTSTKKRTVAPTWPKLSAEAVQIRCPGEAPVVYQKVRGNKVSLWCGPAKTKAASEPAPKATGTRYVQVGTYRVAQNAANAAARIQQNGLPVRTTQLTQKGKTYQVVLAGPFETGAEVKDALATARRIGFTDAFARR